MPDSSSDPWMPVTMKRVTGNNAPASKFRVSIQQTLDGHSFSRPDLNVTPPSEECVEVELLLPHVVLVPEAFDRSELRKQILAANGTPAAPTEEIVACEAKNGCVALVAVDRAVLDAISAKFPRARFSSPLEHLPKKRDKCLWIACRETIAFVKVYNNGQLLLAEAIPAASEAEIEYFFKRLGTRFPLAEYELLVAGDNPKALRKWIGKPFLRVVCE